MPRLRVKKDWFEGLDADHVDHRHPDINAVIVDGEDNEVPPPGSSGNDRDVPLEPLLNLPKIVIKATPQDHPEQPGGPGLVPLPASADAGAAADPALSPPAGADMAAQGSVPPPPPGLPLMPSEAEVA